MEPFSDDVLTSRLKEARARYAALLQQSRAGYGQKPNVEAEALRELSSALEELNVSMEELRAQNDALRDAYHEVERERQHFQDLFTLVPDAYIVTDALGSIVEANDATEKLLRMSVERLRGKPLAVFVADADRRTFRQHLNAIRQNDERAEWTALVVPRAAAPVRATIRAAALKDDDKPRRVGWTIRDSSEIQRAATLGQRLVEEQSARIEAEQSARRLRLLAEIGRQIAVEADIQRICQNTARTIVRHLGDHCDVLLLEGNALRSAAHGNRETRQAPFCEALRRRHNMLADDQDSLLWTAVNTNEVQVSPTIPSEEDRAPLTRNALYAALREHGPRNAVAIPLSVSGAALGVIVVLSTTPTPQFRAEDVAALSEVSMRVALAITNARLIAQLEEANREKAHFLAVLSHELRTPLTAVMGYVDLVMSGVGGAVSGRNREYLERIKSCSWHELSVVEQILHFARLDSGADEPTLTEVNAQEIVTEVIELIGPVAEQKKVQLNVDVPTSPITFRSDAGRIRQILANLLTNAFKFTDEGAVSLVVRRSDDELFFTVSDTGVGIAAADLPRVFDPFWRAHREDPIARTGMGLGLAVSGRLARSIGGEIGVQSQLAVGTTFTFRLPLR